METQIIKSAAIVSKKGGGVHVKIWFTDLPQRTDELDEWLSTGKYYQFKDDLQAGKFMWLAGSIYQKLNPEGGNYYNTLTKTGVFISLEYLHLIGIEDEKIYMRPIPEPPKEITITFEPTAVSPEERLAHIARKQNVQKTITVTGKTIWKYAWVGALIGLVIGMAWGLVLGAVYF